jgi:ubiquinone/menaquinone biosynthesis C-methylase UbiE
LKDHELSETANEGCDVLVSTLALGYMPNLEATIGEWCRVLKRDGIALITDFHPRAAATSNRNFRHEGRIVNIRHYVHSLAYLRTTAARAGLEEVRFVEKVVDDSIRRFYESNDALSVFNQSKGLPLVYGMMLQKPSSVAVYDTGKSRQSL